MQVDDVHSSHSQTGTVNHASDISVERDVVEVEVGSLDLPLGSSWDSHAARDVLPPVVGIVVEPQLQRPGTQLPAESSAKG